MDDLISREALIERYAKEYAKNLIVYGVNIEEKLETATQISCALNQAYMRGRQDELDNIARRQVSQWIPCSERMPEEDKMSEYYESVIVTLDNGRVTNGCYRNMDEEWLVDAKDGEKHSMNATGHVIAWMPLPEPYKGE